MSGLFIANAVVALANAALVARSIKTGSIYGAAAHAFSCGFGTLGVLVTALHS